VSNFTFNFPSDWNIEFDVEHTSIRFFVTKDGFKGTACVVWVAYDKRWEVSLPEWTGFEDVIHCINMQEIITYVNMGFK